MQSSLLQFPYPCKPNNQPCNKGAAAVNGTRKVGKVHQNVLVFCKGSVEETIDSFEELQVKKALEIFNKSRGK